LRRASFRSDMDIIFETMLLIVRPREDENELLKQTLPSVEEKGLTSVAENSD